MSIGNSCMFGGSMLLGLGWKPSIENILQAVYYKQPAMQPKAPEHNVSIAFRFLSTFWLCLAPSECAYCLFLQGSEFFFDLN